MSRRNFHSDAATTGTASERQKRILFKNTLLTTSTGAITYEEMVKAGVRAENLIACGLGLRFFHDAGVSSPTKLARLGVDALHLNEPAFAREACALYGAEALVDTFCNTVDDAIALAGSEAIDILGVSVEKLLQLCAGSPKAAAAVLAAEEARGLAGVRADTLLDTGLRAGTLKSLGIGLMQVGELEGASVDTGLKFNFKL